MLNFRSIAVFALFLCAALAGAQTVTVSASHLGGPRPITGTITFQPVLIDGSQASAKLSTGGQMSKQPLTAAVTAGAFSLPYVVDTSVSNPANLCYQVTARAQNGLQVLGEGYSCVQPATNNSWCTSGTCNFDLYIPNLSPLLQVVTGPTGPAGSVNPAQLQANVAGAIPAAVALAQGSPVVNLFDSAALTSGEGLTPTDTASAYTGVFYTGYMVVAGQSTVVSSGDVIGNGTYRSNFYDATKTLIGSTGATVITAGTSITVPAGAVYARFTYVNGAIPGYTVTNPATLVVVPGTALPSSYVQSARAIYQGQANQLAQLTPLTAKKFAVFGDSISDLGALSGTGGVHWEYIATAITGAQPGINRAEAGRRMFQAFNEYLSADLGTINTSALASDLSTADEIVVYLSTNDTLELAQGHIVVGALTDTEGGCNRTQGSTVSGPYAYSFYAYAQCVIDTLQLAAPSKKIVIVGQYHRQVPAGQTIPTGDYTGYGTDAQIDALDTALQAIAKSRSIYYVDLAETSGIGVNTIANPDGSPLFLRDHLHPSDTLGFPAVARQIARGMVSAF